MTPTSSLERYEFLDVLRGFALFGIITANMILYAFCGALLLPFVKVRNRTVLAFSVLALLAPAAIKFVGGIPRGIAGPASFALPAVWFHPGISGRHLDQGEFDRCIVSQHQ